MAHLRNHLLYGSVKLDRAQEYSNPTKGQSYNNHNMNNVSVGRILLDRLLQIHGLKTWKLSTNRSAQLFSWEIHTQSTLLLS